MSRMKASNRKLLQASMLTVAAVFTVSAPTASAVTKAWNTDSGTWSNASHWSPNGVPTASDVVLMGSTAAAHDSSVSLDVNTTLSGLTITDGMILEARTRQITVNGNTTISGDNGPAGGYTSRISMWHNFTNPYDLRTNNLSIVNGGDMFLDETKIAVMGSMLIDGASSIAGSAELNFYSNTGPALTLDGEILLGIYGPGPYTFTLNQLGSGLLDLDGGVADDNAIDVAGYDASFTVNGTQLYDSFDDTFLIGHNCDVDMNLSGGWTLGTTGWIAFVQNGYVGDCLLTGGTITTNGTITFVGGGSTGRVEAPLVLNTGSLIVGGVNSLLAKNSVTVNTGRIDIYSQNDATFDGPFVLNSGTVALLGSAAAATFNNSATINGGRIRVADFADVDFNGTTTVNGGTFDVELHGDLRFDGNTRIFGGTFNAHDTFGGIDFNGPTEYRNTINMSGHVRQNGAAKVDYATTINAETFDMDGNAAVTKWSINAPLTVNATRINQSNNAFTGEITLTSTTSSPARLAVNLPAGQAWTSSGTLNLIGSGFGTDTGVISGSDVNLAGRVNVSFDNAISARANFTAFNVTTINSSSSLRLDGGTVAAPNTIAGAIINGPGTLKSSADHALTGFGTINAGIAFAGGELRADGGTLNINGPVSSVGIIGARQNSTLKFASQFNTGVATRLQIDGGSVVAPSILNNGNTQGHGTISSSTFINNGSMSVNGGTLVLSTVASPDLDGTGEAGKILISSGQLHVINAPADDFNGLAALGANGIMRLDQGWKLGASGLLSMQGSFATSATIVAPSQTIAGTLSLPAASRGRFDAKTTFASGASVTINATSQLELLQDGTISQGASFAGGGTLLNANGAKLTLMHNSAAGTRLTNAGTLQLGSLLTAAASVGTFDQTPDGDLQIDLFGATPGTLFDRLDVTQSANIGGVLHLSTGFYNPAYLQQHEIVHSGGARNGVFSDVAGMQLSPTKYLAVTYDADSVNVTAALPGDANLDGTVNIADFAVLGVNFNLTGTWVDGSFDGNLQIDIRDFALLGANFNTSIPADPPRAGAVPEPSAAGLLAGVGMVVLPRRKRDRR